MFEFGGACGTLASLGDKGLDVQSALARELGLAQPDIAWHTERDRIAEAGCFLGLLTGTLGKFATDLKLMMQTEVGEASEPYVAQPRLLLHYAAEAQPDLLRLHHCLHRVSAARRRSPAGRDDGGPRARDRAVGNRMDHAAVHLHPSRRRAEAGRVCAWRGLEVHADRMEKTST